MADISKIKLDDVAYDLKDATARTGLGDLSALGTTEKSNLVAAINEMVAQITSLSGITYLESNDTSNLVSIRDLNSGTYVFYGKFKPFASSTATITFSSKLLVNVVKQSSATHVMVIYPVNNCVQYLNVTDSAYERKNIYLTDLQAELDEAIAVVDELTASVGTIADLTTTDKTSLVAAINALVAAIPTVPTALKNPKALTFTGAATGSYDGSAAKTVNIPTVPSALKNPNKLIFTGAVSGEYDGSGELTVEIPDNSDIETVTKLSANLFDKSTALGGSNSGGKCFYYSSSGLQLVDTSHSFYQYVPLRGAGTYRTKWNNAQHSSTGARVGLVNDNNSWVQTITGTLTNTDNIYAYDMEFTVTQEMINNGATKFAFDCHTNLLDTVMVVKDMEYPDEYIPYGYIEVATESAKKQSNILCGKVAVFLGDSICAGTTVEGEYYNYGWAGLIGEANQMSWTNYGMNGGTVTSLSSVQTSRWLTTQADQALTEHPAADYVIFEGGCNDADQMQDALLGTISSDYATFDTSTFSGAFESLVLKLLTSFPSAKIGYIIPQKMYAQNDHSATGHVHRRFFDRAIEICEKWGIPYVDLWKGNPLNPKLSTASQFYTDGQHLTLAGYQRITPQIEAFMRTL